MYILENLNFRIFKGKYVLPYFQLEIRTKYEISVTLGSPAFWISAHHFRAEREFPREILNMT